MKKIKIKIKNNKTYNKKLTWGTNDIVIVCAPLLLFVPVCISLRRGGERGGGSSSIESGGRWSDEVALLMMQLCAL